MLEQVRAFLHRHPAGPRLAVGYSGGLDSSVLLHCLARLRGEFGLQLSAIHVHHGLSPRADHWAAHCRAICAALDVPLRIERVRVTPAGEGLEAAARAARYAVYAALDVDAIALAQHRDDQAETLLLQLLRGAGLKGLAAMPEARELAGKRLLRPLLDCARADLERYAREQGWTWIEDESNFDTALARNALRHEVMPVLARLSPGGARALAAAAARFGESAALLDDLARLDAECDQLNEAGADARATGLGAIAPLATLLALPEARARNLLRHALESRGVAVRRQRLHEALRQLTEADPHSQPRVDFGDFCLRRHRGWVYLVERRLVADWETIWRGEEELDLGAAGRLRFQRAAGQGARLQGEVIVRNRRGGEAIRLHDAGPTRPLKDLLRESGLPPWERERLPLLLVDGRPVWVATLGVAAGQRAAAGEEGWIISWRP